MPSLHQLMPKYASIEQGNGLARTTDVTLPELKTDMVANAMSFHTTLRDAEAQRPGSLTATHAIIGIQQTTATTVRLASGQAQLADTYHGQDLADDSTVPIVGACRSDVRMDSNTLRRVPDKHGNLQRTPAALDEVEGILTASPIIVKAAKPVGLRLDVSEFAFAGEDITVHVTPAENVRHAVRLAITAETGALAEARVLRPTGGTITTVINALPPGAYSIDVTGTGPSSPYAPVSSPILIWKHTDR
jgi:hypothetical protein